MAGFLAKKLYNVPFVLTARQSLEPCVPGRPEQLGARLCHEKIKLNAPPSLVPIPLLRFSNGTKETSCAPTPWRGTYIHVIYNGIDLDEYQKASDTTALQSLWRQFEDQPYVLLLVITRQKGVTHPSSTPSNCTHQLRPRSCSALVHPAPRDRRECARKLPTFAAVVPAWSGSKRW